MQKPLKFKFSRRVVEALVLVVVVVLIAVLPLFAGTRSYPLTVVEGNSMEPTLLNGDLVYYTASVSEVANGSVIVFTQDTSGNVLLGGLGQPVVIHRVVDVLHVDGVLYYRTRGDNNDLEDAALVRFDRVLGVSALVAPRVGLVFLFFKSPQGLIALVGFIVIFYLSVYEVKAWKDKKKAAFLGLLAQKVLNKEVPEELYKRFELASQNIENINPDQITDAEGRALAAWLKVSLEDACEISLVQCEICQNRSAVFEGSRQVLLVCLGVDGQRSHGMVTYVKGTDKPSKTCAYCFRES